MFTDGCLAMKVVYQISLIIIITGAVRIIGADYDCRYFYCDADHKCCTATSVSLAVADSTRPPEVTAPLFAFSVLGEGPPSLSWDVVWFNHYPVSLDLHVEKDGYYNNSLAKVRQCLTHTHTARTHA